ncbi:MAG: FecR family protein [Verrucomicrobiota bacterium]|jgi:hypothetical protein
MNRNHTLFWFAILSMLLGAWGPLGLKAQDFQYIPNPANTPRWPPTPKPELNPFPFALPAPGPKLPSPKLLAQDLKLEPTAIVLAVHGKVEYFQENQWLNVKPNIQLAHGTTLRTGPDSYVDVFVNGISIIRVTEQTTMQLQKMTRTSAERGADTETILNLERGTILGNVRKLSANSRYEIATPHGVARIRGTDFQVSVSPQTNGAPVVTFTSAMGELVCSAVVDGKSVVKVLRSGESWTVGDKDIKPVPVVIRWSSSAY